MILLVESRNNPIPAIVEAVYPDFLNQYVKADYLKDDVLYNTESLNAYTFPGIPNHVLKLKIGVVFMLLRNISQSSGLCNGTRLIVTQLCSNVIEASIVSGSNLVVKNGCALARRRIESGHNTKDSSNMELHHTTSQQVIGLTFLDTDENVKGCYSVHIKETDAHLFRTKLIEGSVYEISKFQFPRPKIRYMSICKELLILFNSVTKIREVQKNIDLYPHHYINFVSDGTLSHMANSNEYLIGSLYLSTTTATNIYVNLNILQTVELQLRYATEDSNVKLCIEDILQPWQMGEIKEAAIKGPLNFNLAVIREYSITA
ncbi:DNA helicase Pif1-like [Dillenia turbinata]|uniref:DNA helicase Pif1-like n=1 Tax=Dillenia turbinata TaxID=194707 RepID=A0AAN8VLF6_9MAGN